jgi:hypothetical protein
VEELYESCEQFKYKERRTNPILGFRLLALVNPFNSIDIEATLNNKGLIIKNNIIDSFDAISARVNVVATFLNDKDRNRLNKWLNTKFNGRFIVMEIESWRELDDFSPIDPIYEMARVACGILNKEAHINIILTAHDGREMTAQINSVKFFSN